MATGGRGRHMQRIAGRLLMGVLLASAGTLPARADETSLENLPLESLLQTEVTSVLRHASALADTPAAMTVLRREDIAQLGAQTLPDLLRTVPGLHVAQIDNNRWAVAARGFNGFFGSKLLVLIDGRSIYNAVFSGVFWDAYDIPLENIDRIEVIKGPGAAMWGSNAVNGIINIVTQSAHDTAGTQLGLSTGSSQRYRASARIGESGEQGAWRVYAQQQARRASLAQPGRDNPADDSRGVRAGFRADSPLGQHQQWMLNGEVYDAYSGGPAYPLSTSNNLNGYHLLGRYGETHAGQSWQVQSYLDHSWRQEPAIGSVLQQDMLDLDAQQMLELNDRHKLTWGGGWRQYRFQSTNSNKLAFVPAQSDRSIGNLFVQDEITLLPRTLEAVLGLRAEQSSGKPLEWLPSLRLLWHPAAQHTLWFASGRAIRAANLVDTQLRFNGPGFSQPATQINGNPEARPERVESLELGWRGQFSDRLGSDLALYQNHYRDLQSISINSSNTALSYYNQAYGITQGLEWALDYQVNNNWQLRGGYTLYREDLKLTSEAPANTWIAYRNSFPTRQLFLRSLWELSPAQRLDVTVRAVSPIRDGVSGYVTSDWRWSTRLRRQLDFNLIGRNLGGPKHREMGDQPYFLETRVQPEILANLIWHF